MTAARHGLGVQQVGEPLGGQALLVGELGHSPAGGAQMGVESDTKCRMIGSKALRWCCPASAAMVMVTVCRSPKAT
jgi:hypothetical protein